MDQRKSSGENATEILHSRISSEEINSSSKSQSLPNPTEKEDKNDYIGKQLAEEILKYCSREINSSTTAREFSWTNSCTDIFSFTSFSYSGLDKGNEKLYLCSSDNTGLKQVIRAHEDPKLFPNFSKGQKLYIREPDVGDIDNVYLLIGFAPRKPSFFGGSKSSGKPSLPFATILFSDLRKCYKSPMQGQSFQFEGEKGTLSFFYNISRVKTEDIRLETGKGKADNKGIKFSSWIIPLVISLGLQSIAGNMFNINYANCVDTEVNIEN